MNKVAIRVDANEIVATGHVMRCRTIASSLRQMGCSVVFVSADKNILPYMDEDQEVIILDSDWRKLESELPVLIDILHTGNINRLIVDSYYASPVYLGKLERAGIRVLYIDDMQKEVYPVHAVLNYSPGALELNYPEFYGQRRPKFLLGTKYIPLREQFWNRGIYGTTYRSAGKTGIGTDGEALQNIDIIARENQESSLGAHRTYGYENAGIKNVFLTTGGADSMGLSELIITAVLRDPRLGFKEGQKVIHLLAGRFFRVSEKVQQYIEDGYVKLHQNVDNVAEIMEMCDAAITPAGTTLYELCAVGVPSISFVFVENQEPDALYFDKKHLVPYAGDFREDDAEVLRRITGFLLEVAETDSADRIEYGDRLRKVIDGQGADRIAEVVLDM